VLSCLVLPCLVSFIVSRRQSKGRARRAHGRYNSTLIATLVLALTFTLTVTLTLTLKGEEDGYASTKQVLLGGNIIGQNIY
jgi:hypothetical protein